MKILHITPSYKPAYVYGGPIYSVSAICEAQAALGHDVTVFTTNANGATNLSFPKTKLNIISYVSVIYFKRITGDHTHISPVLWFKLCKTCKDYDVIHLHSWWSALIVGCAWILLFRGKRFILSPRGMFSGYSFTHNKLKIKKYILFKFLSYPVLCNQVFHATANSEKLEIVELFGADAKVFTLPNLLTFPLISESDIVQTNKLKKINILFISRIDKKKGIEILLEAVSYLSKKNIAYGLTIIGTGDSDYLENLHSLSKKINTDDNIVWKGLVEWGEKFNDILYSDLLVLPSYNENFANIILETLYAGRPVIVSKYVGLSDYVENNKMGYVIDTDPRELVLAIEKVISERPLWHEKSLEMHRKVKIDFNSNFLANEYIHAYSLLRNNDTV